MGVTRISAAIPSLLRGNDDLSQTLHPAWCLHDVVKPQLKRRFKHTCNVNFFIFARRTFCFYVSIVLLVLVLLVIICMCVMDYVTKVVLIYQSKVDIRRQLLASVKVSETAETTQPYAASVAAEASACA